MAEWRRVAKAFALADGHISEKEVGILTKLFAADGRIDHSELDFLREIKKESKTSVAKLDELIQRCEKLVS